MIGQNGEKAVEENGENDKQDWLVRCDIYLCSVDKTVLMFWYLVQSRLLQTLHDSILPWLHDYSLSSFFTEKVPYNFFNGIGGHGRGHLADINMTPAEWIESHNFAGLTLRTMTALQSPSHVTNGVQIDDVLRLFASLEDADVVSLKKHGMVGYLVVTSSDAMAIKPGLQFSSQLNGLIGLMDPPVLLPETVRN